MAFGKPTLSDVVVDQTVTDIYREIAKRQENVCYVCFNNIGTFPSRATSAFDILTGEKTRKYSPFDIPVERIQNRNRHLFHRPISGGADQPYVMTETDSEKMYGWSIRLNRFL